MKMNWRYVLGCVSLIGLVSLGFPNVPQAQNARHIPPWLQQHVGLEDGKIAAVVLHRARAHYLKKRRQGAVKNPCYLAMDATRPSAARDGQPNARFYVICEKSKTFRAVSSGYGNGRKLPNADFSNGRDCARHFSNAEGSHLTMGGKYLTAETRTSFKGYFRQGGQTQSFQRTFLLFDGEGETRNARERAIGGHQAMFLRWQCRMKKPGSPHADAAGYVPFGRLVDYTSGRSNGCTTWSTQATQEILSVTAGNPTTLYIYPESKDIQKAARAVKTGTPLQDAGVYWNTTCLSRIGAPRFWRKQDLEPVIDAWRASLPKHPARELPICR